MEQIFEFHKSNVTAPGDLVCGILSNPTCRCCATRLVFIQQMSQAAVYVQYARISNAPTGSRALTTAPHPTRYPSTGSFTPGCDQTIFWCIRIYKVLGIYLCRLYSIANHEHVATCQALDV